MNVKKSIALLLAVMMVLSLAACGAKGETGSGDAMTGEPQNAEEAVAMHKELMAQENRALGKGFHGGRQEHDHAGGRQKLR